MHEPFLIRGAAAQAVRILQPELALPRGLCRYINPNAPIEILLDGPAGTGKTTATLCALVDLAERYPGIRILILRAVRKDLNESVLKTLEENVLTVGHPIMDGRRRDTRDFYEFENGSRIVLGGLDKPERLYSTEWDIIYLAEAVEAQESQYIPLFRSLRNFKLPNLRRYVICDTNPHAPTHWLKKRAEMPGKMVWLKAKHRDNPAYYTPAGELTEYGRAYILGTLEPLTGVYRRRLYEGEWAAAEGMIWPHWDEAVHVITAEQFKSIEIVNAYAGIDWGFRDPGCIIVGGIDRDRRIYILEEVYRVGMSIEWWTDQALRVMAKHKVKVFCADPSRPDHIRHMYQAGVPVIGADNEIQFGIDRVRERMVLHEGRPRIAYLRGALADFDPVLESEKKPTGLLKEIWGYVYPQAKDGRPIQEKPDPACAQHAADALRYLVNYVDRGGHVPEREPFKPKTYGDMMGLADILPEYTRVHGRDQPGALWTPQGWYRRAA